MIPQASGAVIPSFTMQQPASQVRVDPTPPQPATGGLHTTVITGNRRDDRLCCITGTPSSNQCTKSHNPTHRTTPTLAAVDHSTTPGVPNSCQICSNRRPPRPTVCCPHSYRPKVFLFNFHRVLLRESAGAAGISSSDELGRVRKRTAYGAAGKHMYRKEVLPAAVAVLWSWLFPNRNNLSID